MRAVWHGFFERVSLWLFTEYRCLSTYGFGSGGFIQVLK